MTASRLVLIAAILAGTTYVGSWFIPGLPPAASTVWKGAGVALLALWAAMNARGLDGWLISVVLAFGALGDVLLETHGLVVGALAFLAGHLTAIGLYLKNRQRPLAARDMAFAVALIPVVVTVAYLLPPERNGAGLVALYALGLISMASAAWVSRFPRALVATGALMFVASDLLIFARTGRPQFDTFFMGLGVWGLYFAGQAFIALGVVRTLRQPAQG